MKPVPMKALPTGFFYICEPEMHQSQQPEKRLQDVNNMRDVSYLLWVMWLLTRCPAARAAIRESSPASTVPQTTRAS